MAIKEAIQAFLAKPIGQEMKAEDTVTYFTKDWQELAQCYVVEDAIQSITWYEPKAHLVSTEEEQLQFIEHIQTVFQKQQLVLETWVDKDTHYAARLSIYEPTYQIPLHSTGISLVIGYEGTLEDLSFGVEDVAIVYPEKMITAQEAKQIIRQQPLMKLMIRPDVGWHYVYGPDFNIGGVETDGTVRLMMNMPEMEGASLQALPAVEAVPDLEAFLVQGREVAYERREIENDVIVWEMYSEEPETVVAVDLFEQACIALKTIVGVEYTHYMYESVPNLSKVLGLDFADDAFVSYRFVYVQDELTLDFHATNITVNKETNRIQTIVQPYIPYEQLKQLEPPTLTVEEANAIAQKLVDVELSLERQGFGSTTYSFIYQMDYPTSSTKGHIQHIDAWTGEVYFVETGL